MGSPNKRVLQTSTETVGNISGGGCMHGNCCKQKNENNTQKKLLVKNCWRLRKALALRDQQTAMQPRQPQGSATIMINIIIIQQQQQQQQYFI